MTKKHLLLRANGNSSIGLGHLFRLIGVIEMLADQFDFTFLTSANSASDIIPPHYPKRNVPEVYSTLDEPDWLAKTFTPETTIIITDGYSFDSNYQKKIHDLGFKLVVIDDLAIEHIYADILVNHSPNITPENYSAESYTKFALGPQFSMLRPSFIEVAKEKRNINSINNLFICFGGADPHNITMKILQYVLDFFQFNEIHVLIGVSYSHKAIHEAFIDNKNVTIHQNLLELQIIDVMKRCELGIASSSTILYEMCAVNMHILSGYYVDNQENIYNGFVENGLIHGLGDLQKMNIEQLSQLIKQTMENHDESDQIERQAKLFDAKISDRFNSLISSLC